MGWTFNPVMASKNILRSSGLCLEFISIGESIPMHRLESESIRTLKTKGVVMHDVEERAVVIDLVLRRLTEKKNLKQCEVAHKVGIPPSTFHDWTYGRVPRDLGAVKKIADYFKVDFEYLIFGGKNDQEAMREKISKLEYENAILKLERENQLNLFETREQAFERIEEFKKQVEIKFKNEDQQ